MGEQLARVLIVDHPLCEPVADAHHKRSFCLTNVYLWIDTIIGNEKEHYATT